MHLLLTIHTITIHKAPPSAGFLLGNGHTSATLPDGKLLTMPTKPLRVRLVRYINGFGRQESGVRISPPRPILRVIELANNDRAAILTVKQAKGLRTAAHKGGSDAYLKEAPLKPSQNRIQIRPICCWSHSGHSGTTCFINVIAK